jgi:hypothetical protein
MFHLPTKKYAHNQHHRNKQLKQTNQIKPNQTKPNQNRYMNFPIAITVEGANIMTRSFQIIGQGITRCHPHMLHMIESLQSDAPDAADKFGVEHVFSFS